MPFGAVSALCLMAIGSTANAAACISLGSPNAGGIPAEGCSIGGTESNFTNLTDSASDAAILWSGTTHTVPDNINDDEDHVEAALDHIFNQFVDVERLVRLDSGLSGRRPYHNTDQRLTNARWFYDVQLGILWPRDAVIADYESWNGRHHFGHRRVNEWLWCQHADFQ